MMDAVVAASILGAAALIASFCEYKGRKKMSQATDRLTASVQAATDAVHALVARIPAPAPPVDEAPVIAAADALDALTAQVNATLPAA